MSDEPPVRERLAAVAMFQGLDEAELDELTHSAKTKNLDAGEDLIVEGSNSDALYVVLEGNFDVTRLTQGVQLPLGNVDPGEVVGEMAMLERAPRNATVTAVVPSQVVEVPGAAIEKLLNNPAAALAMVRTVTGRLRSTELALRQSQHMKLLGETTALLLHNLNNPAAAARRAAAYLDQAVPRWRRGGGAARARRGHLSGAGRPFARPRWGWSGHAASSSSGPGWRSAISPGHRRCRTRSSVEGSRWPTWMGWNRPFLPTGSRWW